MNKFYQYKLLLILLGFILANPVYADNLGRIFTTSDERQKLEKIRNAIQKPKKVETVKVEEIIEPVETKKEVIIRDAITLKGLVHRSDGKSTAWVNESNTFEGDLDSQFIQVPDNKIKSDQVTIIMPDDSTEIELKVGEGFSPKPIQRDIVTSEPIEREKVEIKNLKGSL
jgi:hypothetical protein